MVKLMVPVVGTPSNGAVDVEGLREGLAVDLGLRRQSVGRGCSSDGQGARGVGDGVVREVGGPGRGEGCGDGVGGGATGLATVAVVEKATRMVSPETTPVSVPEKAGLAAP